MQCRCGNRVAIIKMREGCDCSPALSFSLSHSLSLSRVCACFVDGALFSQAVWPLLMFLNRIFRVSECLQVAPNPSPSSSRASRALGVWLDDAQKGEVNCGGLEKRSGVRFGARC